MNDNTISILAHMTELKRRLFRVAIVAAIFIAIAVANFSFIFNRFTADSRELIEAAGGDIIQLTLTEAWVAAAKLAVMVGLTAASAYVVSTKETKLGLDLSGGTRLVYQGQPTQENPEVDPQDVDRSVEIIRERVDKLGVAKHVAQTDILDHMVLNLGVPLE